jgi:hypothetical protein
MNASSSPFQVELACYLVLCYNEALPAEYSKSEVVPDAEDMFGNEFGTT